MVWVTKITYSKVSVGVSVEHQKDIIEMAVNLAKTREDFCDSDEPKYEVSSIFKIAQTPKTKEELVDEVIDQIKNDFYCDDTKSLSELLRLVDDETLIAYLPEEGLTFKNK